MKAPRVYPNHRGFTLIELLAIVAAVMVLAALLLPAVSSSRPRKYAAWCIYQLKQIDTGFVLYAPDHMNQFPMQIPVASGGTRELVESGHAFLQFQKLQHYVPGTNLCTILICPFDTNRQPAADSQTLTDSNLSFFLNADAQLNIRPAKTILVGHRDLTINGQPLSPGLHTVPTNTNLDWSGQIHPQGGILGYADGHVQMIRTGALQLEFAMQPAITNRLLIP